MQKGDFLKVDFTGRVAGTNEIFDTTVEEIARQEGIVNKHTVYEPVLVVLGERMVVPGLEAQLETMGVGDERDCDILPGDGFGKRDVRLTKVIPIGKFAQENITPVPGALVSIDGMNARIQSVSGGRVRVDFNHPLAGRPLHYWIRITEKIEPPPDRAKELLTYYGLQAQTELAGDVLRIETDKEVQTVVKKFFEEKIIRLVPEIKALDFAPAAAGNANAASPEAVPPETTEA